MIRWGVTAGAHDASLTVVKDDEILFAGHSERYSGIKNDPWLSQGLVDNALEYGHPDVVTWYENTLLKRIRQVWSGQYKTAFTKISPSRQLMDMGIVSRHMMGDDDYGMVDNALLNWSSHHETHAAAGYYTGPYTDAAVLVIDSIGEFQTTSIWQGQGTNLTRRWSQSYPHSIGLWYSAMTQRIGLKPNEDEYILMGWAALGDPEKYRQKIYEDFFQPLQPGNPQVKFKHNLHRGCRWWAPELNTVQDYADIAASTQAVYEMVFKHLITETRRLVDSTNLVVMGGCALNCVANSIAHEYYYGNVWIMPNPGDAGSSLGAIASRRNQFIEWKGPYLGYNIPGAYPVKGLLHELKTTRLVGVANGRAEFGPRALGNRSLFADPRGADVKDLVNTVKRRQEFRPFAPMVLAEHADKYFDGATGPYMQYTSVCKRPDLFPAIAHLDNTSRVQTVTKKDHPGLHQLMTEWHAQTGCPIILNTSLNIKGKPMVNDEADAAEWTKLYGVKVYTHD